MRVKPSFICLSCRVNLRRRVLLLPARRSLASSPSVQRPVGPAPHQERTQKSSDLYADILSLNQAIDANDTTAAYDRFSALFARHRHENLSSYAWNERLFDPPTITLLERVTAEYGKTPDAAGPSQLLDQLRDAQVLDTRHYLAVLTQMLRDGRPAEEMLPFFEGAADLHDGHLRDDDTLLGGFFAGASLEQDAMFYVIFILLLESRIASARLDSLGAHLDRMRVPSEQQLRNVLLSANVNQVTVSRIIELASQAKTTLLFRPQVLSKVVERYTNSDNPVGLLALYNYSKSLQPSPLDEYAYTIFITAFLSFGRSQQSNMVGVWNDMVASGIHPSVNVWTALIAGYGRHSRDPSVIPSLWQRMILSGVVPDAHCWTSRIHAQLSTNQLEAGFESLQLMQDAGVKPTIATINAVIDGLLRFNHPDKIPQVLQLADKLGIQTDIITYNSLLRGTAVNLEDVKLVLKKMEQFGVTPDVVTITTVIDALYKDSSALPKIDQVLELLEYMESIGVRPNINTYTTLIQGVLRAGDNEAVDAIFTSMSARGVVPNATTYTILIKAAFDRGDVYAVENYWEDLKERRVRPDRVIWTETIWGFADIGDVARMDYYRQMMKDVVGSNTFTLTGYTIIVRALVRHRQYTAARELAEETVQSESFLRVPLNSKAEKIFWELVAEAGPSAWVQELKQKALDRRNSRNEEQREMALEFDARNAMLPPQITRYVPRKFKGVSRKPEKRDEPRIERDVERDVEQDEEDGVKAPSAPPVIRKTGLKPGDVGVVPRARRGSGGKGAGAESLVGLITPR